LIWAVVDTNVLVSGFGWSGSVPAQIVDRAIRGEYLLCTSRPLLRELSRVMAYPKLRRVFDDPAGIVRLLERVALVVEPSAQLNVLEDDPDNRLLEVADESGADFVVSGDAAVLKLARWHATAIVTPREFLAALRQ
jgi:putative PIN family toxin of toxin-antitoxin system